MTGQIAGEIGKRRQQCDFGLEDPQRRHRLGHAWRRGELGGELRLERSRTRASGAVVRSRSRRARSRSMRPLEIGRPGHRAGEQPANGHTIEKLRPVRPRPIALPPPRATPRSRARPPDPAAKPALRECARRAPRPSPLRSCICPRLRLRTLCARQLARFAPPARTRGSVSTARRPGSLSSSRMAPPCKRATAATRLSPSPVPGCVRHSSRRTNRFSARVAVLLRDPRPVVGDADLGRVARSRGDADLDAPQIRSPPHPGTRT